MTKEQTRRRNLKRRFGITPKEYDEMVEAQGGLCALCGKAEAVVNLKTGQPKRLTIDHCHSTRCIRGLLCSTCNRALGLFNDDPTLTQAATDYLLKPVSGKVIPQKTDRD